MTWHPPPPKHEPWIDWLQPEELEDVRVLQIRQHTAKVEAARLSNEISLYRNRAIARRKRDNARKREEDDHYDGGTV
jgi:hypothetical protein